LLARRTQGTRNHQSRRMRGRSKRPALMHRQLACTHVRTTLASVIQRTCNEAGVRGKLRPWPGLPNQRTRGASGHGLHACVAPWSAENPRHRMCSLHIRVHISAWSCPPFVAMCRRCIQQELEAPLPPFVSIVLVHNAFDLRTHQRCRCSRQPRSGAPRS
jgi:hypothetical protein